MNYISDTNIKSHYLKGPKIFILFYALITLLFLYIAYTLPLIDPSEGRYAVISQHMAETGNYITPQILENGIWVPYLGKPPLYFWVSSISIKLFGVNEFAVRLPGILASSMLLLLIFWIIKRYKDEQTAYLSVLLTATSGLFFIVTTTILADTVMTFFAIGSLLLYYGFLNEKHERIRYLLSIAIFIFLGFAFLSKGPVGLVIFGLPVFLWTLLNNQWKTLKHHAWIIGSLAFLLITTPWFYLASKIHPDFLEYFFVNENFKRFTSNDYGDRYGSAHHYPYGMSVIFFIAGAQPWLLLLVFAIIRKLIKHPKEKWKESLSELIFYKVNNKRFISYFLLGFTSIVLFWCLAKQLHFYYLFTVVPPFAIWCTSILKREKISSKLILVVSCVALIVYAISFLLIPYFAENKISKNIIKDTLKLNPHPLKNSILFVHRTANSAYFYGHKAIILHNKESVESSLLRPAQFYILREKDFKNLSSIEKKRFAVLHETENWIVLKNIEKTKKDHAL